MSTQGDARMLESVVRCLDRALAAMNEAVAMTAEHGPAVALEFIADFLNDTDGADEEMCESIPGDWLTRWRVAPATQKAEATR